MIGQTLSHYKIISKLGQGGMGEVYLAEDSRLDRKVALKILPQHLSERAELRERFEREARAVSSLNHPHICTLHDIGEQDGIHYLVMEHLVGETLEARLAKGALPLEQTLEYAIQIADALDKAHRQGVVHRDLKPGNIMLVKSGAKLLDFGLAKLQAAETPTNLSALPTEQANLTAEGTILGTLQYMAPEQLEAKEADSRTDIFAFGAVVYEMATGKKAFEGKSQASLIAAIMGQEPRPMAELQPMTPSTLDHVVRRCMAKESDKRWQAASDVMEELKWVTEVRTPVDSLPVVTGPAAWKRAIPWGIAAVAVFLAGLAFLSLTSPSLEQVTRFAVVAPPTAPLANSGGRDLLISADGRRIVYLSDQGGMDQLYTRSQDELEGTLITGTEGALPDPFFSPDGEWVAFSRAGKLEKVSVIGGASTTLCDAPTYRGGSWATEDTIVFAAGAELGTGLYRVSAAGGEPEILATPDAEKSELGYVYPEILPGGKAVLFTILDAANQNVAVLSLETGEQKILLQQSRQAHYTPTGHLIYERSATGTLMAVAFNLSRLELEGAPAPILQEVRQSRGVAVDYSVSEDGTLIYVPAPERLKTQLVWVDKDGAERLLTKESRGYSIPRISPDGHRVALTISEDDGSRNVWVYDLDEDLFSRLTFEGNQNALGIWEPDGKWITFDSDRNGPRLLFRQLADGSGPAEPLPTTLNTVAIPNSWSPDGSVLAFHMGATETQAIWILPMEGEREPRALIESLRNYCCVVFSLDGHWIAYVSTETGQRHVYVSPYQEVDVKWLVSGEEGGGEPVWSPTTKELFYRSGDKMMAVSYETKPTFRPGKPQELFEHHYLVSSTNPGYLQYYDVSRDGERFLMIKEDDPAAGQINVVLNWFEELKRLVPTGN